MENENFRGGSMDNLDGTVNNAIGTMYIQNHVQLRNLKKCWWIHEYHKHYLWTINYLVSNAYMVMRLWNHEQCIWNLEQNFHEHIWRHNLGHLIVESRTKLIEP